MFKEEQQKDMKLRMFLDYLFTGSLPEIQKTDIASRIVKRE